MLKYIAKYMRMFIIVSQIEKYCYWDIAVLVPASGAGQLALVTLCNVGLDSMDPLDCM